MNKLFVFLRSDLISMTPGKAAAQVAHAASQAAYRYIRSDCNCKVYSGWATSAMDVKDKKYPDENYDGFGTTIVLDGGTQDQLMSTAGKLNLLVNRDYTGVVVDPTYPVRDGAAVHLIDIPTCAWLLYSGGDTDIDLILSAHKLYNGNNV